MCHRPSLSTERGDAACDDDEPPPSLHCTDMSNTALTPLGLKAYHTLYFSSCEDVCGSAKGRYESAMA